MTNEQLQEIKNNLIQEKKEAETELKRMEEYGPHGSLLEWTDELSSYDNHPADLGSETFEMEKHMALNVHQQKYLEDINDALKKIENGTYGICETCSKEIEYERLKAIPYAKECISCAKAHQINPDDFNKDRPAKEEVIGPVFNRNFMREEDGDINHGAEIMRQLEAYGSADNMQDMGWDVKDYDEINNLYDTPQDTVDEVDLLSNQDRKNALE